MKKTDFHFAIRSGKGNAVNPENMPPAAWLTMTSATDVKKYCFSRP